MIDETEGVPRPVTMYGDPVLTGPCAPVERFDDELRQLVRDMFATMYAADGVGLAANQVGVSLRVFVLDCPSPSGPVKGHVVNPVLELPAQRELEVELEGCLSLPGEHRDLARVATAAVTGVDVDGQPVRIEASGFAARCLQHECDHLDGTVFIDRLPTKVRKGVLKALAAAAGQASAGSTLRP